MRKGGSPPACSRPMRSVWCGASRAMASLFTSFILTRERRSRRPAQRALGRFEYLRRLDGGQAAEITRLADALIARPARQLAGVHRFGDRRGGAPWRRSDRQRWPVQPDDRHARRRRDVERTAVAADVERRAIEQRAKLGERELTARQDLACASAAEGGPRLD